MINNFPRSENRNLPAMDRALRAKKILGALDADAPAGHATLDLLSTFAGARRKAAKLLCSATA